MIEHAALGFLLYRPLSMYAIKKAMERSTRHFLSASFGSLHPTLRKLETKGYVTSEACVENGRNKKVFSITEAGREHFIGWLARDIASERVSDPSLLRLFFMGHLEPAARQDLLARFLGEMQRAAEELERLREDVQGGPVPHGFEDHLAHQLATLDFGIAYHRFVKDWYQARLEVLNRASGSGEPRLKTGEGA